jgi:hypothetical protein
LFDMHHAEQVVVTSVDESVSVIISIQNLVLSLWEPVELDVAVALVVALSLGDGLVLAWLS